MIGCGRQAETQVACIREAQPSIEQVVAYCRGPYCVTAVRAVAELRDKGFSAFRLPLDVNEWKGTGAALEAGAAVPSDVS